MSIADRLRHVLSGPQLPWIVLWIGLTTLIVGLIVLTRTSWGQSRPLRKCAALSLLVHLLLAAYLTTVQIVSAGSPDGRSDRGAINITLADDPDQPTADGLAGQKSQPVWDQFAASGRCSADGESGPRRSRRRRRKFPIRNCLTIRFQTNHCWRSHRSNRFPLNLIPPPSIRTKRRPFCQPSRSIRPLRPSPPRRRLSDLSRPAPRGNRSLPRMLRPKWMAAREPPPAMLR